MVKVKINGDTYFVGRDARLWEKVRTDVGTAIVPVDTERFEALVEHDEQFENAPSDAVLLSVQHKRRPSLKQLNYVRAELASATDDEAYAIFLRHRRNGRRVAVIPPQEVESATFTAKLDNLLEKWRDWRLEATLHTHPGEWVGASQTDIDEFSELPCFHFIGARRADKLMEYAVVRGFVFECAEYTLKPSHRQKIKMCDINGGENWRGAIKKKQRIVVPVSSYPAQSSLPFTWSGDGRQSSSLANKETTLIVRDAAKIGHEQSQQHGRRKLLLQFGLYIPFNQLEWDESLSMWYLPKGAVVYVEKGDER